jgi:hypothetical protein
VISLMPMSKAIWHGDCLFVLQPRAISREAQLDRVQQVLVAERLGQELDRSFLLSPGRTSGCRHVR